MPLPSFTSLTSTTAWLNKLSESRNAYWLLFVASMMETLIVPIPIEVILIPWMLCHPEKKWRIAAVALAGNLAAASIGYWLGNLVMDQWGDTLIQLFGGQAAYSDFQTRFNRDGFMAIAAIAVVPVPFQIAMLVAGVSDYPFPLFVLAAVMARSIRYFGLAILVQIFGNAAMRVWNRHSKPVGIGLVVVFFVWVGWQFKGSLPI
ncbi:VTT domain-containing protein [Halomonas sp. McH1-25]|uniref:YqaA family protein n=1 Tax=unclassified Halomonas TaxID=2609666 RepID=UPI001EF6147B|nr:MULTISPECIES: VTT domain-containing protein [unclassified Halomonas]MCG7601247.1 VTT domain-containing protein [Halomonas sp. McH1-25]MCP1343705.1 VTT domain-containing protein [Halomonas sp. FL8]MCP1362105.1 VTT domain-containing protein [Halomonas sp. BBD45]MCP1365577.1 VTT domain-containing protein [Halomonas sp. BBD48]